MRFIAIIMAFMMGATPVASTPTDTSFIIDRIIGGYSVVEVAVGDDIVWVDVPVGDYSHPAKEGMHLEVSCVSGQILAVNQYYYFVSYDKTHTWVLTEEQMGLIPDFSASYTLYYYENETPDYIYDDIFFRLKENV